MNPIDILTDRKYHDYLISIDPSLAILFNTIDKKAFPLPKTPYVALIGAVIGQIIRYNQAKKVRSNLYRLYGSNFTINEIIKINNEEWKAIGLDINKIEIINRLNTFILDNNINLNLIDNIYKLKIVTGIGKWTIETTILTAFMDWDVFPCGDLFLRKRIQRLYNLPKVPTIKETTILTEKYKPFRSFVAWYLWRWF